MVDERLYVAVDLAVPGPAGDKVAPIMMRVAQRTDKKTDGYKLGGGAGRFMEAKESGNRDKHVGTVTLGDIPEGDVFSPEGREIKRGWRTIANTLIKKEVASAERVRRAFGSSIGESDYDRMSFEQKAQKFIPKVKPYAF